MNETLALFTSLPPNDQGARILNVLLGPGWEGLVGGSGQAGTAATLAQNLLATFNWVALAGVCLLFVVVMIQGVAGTACEGVPLGRRYSSLWMPLRFAGALGFLAPVIKGLSAFQALMLVFVGGSVNLANYLWSQGLDQFVKNGGEMSLAAPKDLIEDSRNLGQGLLKALTVQEYFRQRMDLGVSGALVDERHWPAHGDVEGILVMTPAVPEGCGLGPGDLGRLRISCPDPSGDLCRARLSAVRTLVSDLGPLAETLANPNMELTLSETGALAQAVSRYRDAVRPHLETVRNEEAEVLASDLAQFSQAAADNGWATAGSYYWTIARLSERSAALYYSSARFYGGDPPIDGDALGDYEIVHERLNRYLAGAFRPERASAAEGPPAEFPSTDWFADSISSAFGRMPLSDVVVLLAQGDPIPVLAGLGRSLVSAGEGILILKLGATAGSVAVGASTSSLLGQVASVFTGSVSSAVAGGVVGAVEALAPYLVFLSLLLMGYGAVLAYFLPAIPFVLWLAGLLAWLVTVIEALAAAPLWVAAHALPEGEGLAGNAGRRGYLLFLGVLLRPPMMVFAFLMAMALLNGIGRMVGHVFSVFGFDRLGETFIGPMGFVAFSAILGLCAMTAAWKLFGLVSRLPDRVMVWIGGGGDHHGEIEDAKRVQAGTLTASNFALKAIGPLVTKKGLRRETADQTNPAKPNPGP
ncbi:MAG: DotA/TraY family protein [Deltaproteobacteria bacterium]|jgi:hypothetical protein|nr:DotA/TraY family protein [Deltaproteobacteria bacterium]